MREVRVDGRRQLVPVPEFGPLDVLADRAHRALKEGRLADVVRDCRRDLPLVRSAGDATTARYLQYLVGSALRDLGRYREAMSSALDLLGDLDPEATSWRAKALALLADASAQDGELGRALDALAEAQALVRVRCGSGQLEMSAQMAVALALRSLTLFEHADELFAGLLRAGDGSDPDNEVLDQMQAALHQAQWGAALEAADLAADAGPHFARSAEVAVRWRRTAVRSGRPDMAARAEVVEAYALSRLGHLDLACARVRAALPRFAERAELAEGQLVHLVLGEAAAAGGDHAAAREHLSQAAEGAQRAGRVVWVLAAERALADVDVAEHGPHPAVERWRRLAGEVVQRTWRERDSRFAALRDRHQLREMAAASDASARAAQEDPLTGLGNRRRLAAGLAGLSDPDGEVSVVFVDVDRFKAVNDEFSHAVGDEVLRRMAVLLRGQCRTDDVVVRYGGDEFVVLVPAGAEAAGEIAARVHAAVRATAWQELAPGLEVTVSVGVASAPGAADAVAAADAALLAAKRAGRDRVVPV